VPRVASRLLLAFALVALVAAVPLGRAAALVVDQQGGVGADTTEPAASDELTVAKALVLGVVEGVTEYLPISSTGHLLIAQELLGVGTSPETEAAAETYAIAIQLGAILAVLVLYRKRLVSMANGAVGRDPGGRRALIGVLIAFIPAVVIGLLFEGAIKDNLLEPWPIVAAWAIGGVVILTLGVRLERRGGGVALEDLDLRQALLIGVAQCLAMWPGTSRSMITILVALAVGLSLQAAVEFSFLLGLATLGAATSYEILRNGGDLFATYGYLNPIIGLVAAFVSAVVAVRWMVEYLQRNGLAIFGWYRLVVAAVVAGLLLAGTI